MSEDCQQFEFLGHREPSEAQMSAACAWTSVSTRFLSPCSARARYRSFKPRVKRAQSGPRGPEKSSASVARLPPAASSMEWRAVTSTPGARVIQVKLLPFQLRNLPLGGKKLRLTHDGSV